jgi:hypothetical protein
VEQPRFKGELRNRATNKSNQARNAAEHHHQIPQTLPDCQTIKNEELKTKLQNQVNHLKIANPTLWAWGQTGTPCQLR